MKLKQCIECRKNIPKHYIIDYCKDCRIKLDITLSDSQLQETDICENCDIEIPKHYVLKFCKPCRKELKLGKWQERKTQRWRTQSAQEKEKRRKWLARRYHIRLWHIKKALESDEEE